MQQLLSLTLMVFMSLFTFNKSEDLFEEAKRKMVENKTISYTQTGLYPDPMGNYTPYPYTVSISENSESLVGFDYIMSSERADMVYINTDYKKVEHEESSVYFFPKAEMENDVIGNLRYTPMAFLKHTDWQYVNDTTIEGTDFSDYFRVENDKVHNGNTIYTEQHILINPKTKLIERFERRNYFNRELSQKVVYLYEDYELDSSIKPLAFTFPDDYKTSLYGRKDKVQLNKGELAPMFSAIDLDGNNWTLEEYRGKKVLIDFSIINCGYCFQSVKYFNQEENKLADNIEVLYISTEDSQEKLQQFDEQFNIPFRAVADAEAVGEMYGISSWPIFYLIDEEGRIEDVIVGFDKEKLSDLKAK